MDTFFFSLLKELVQSETLIATLRIRTQLSEFIFFDDKYFVNMNPLLL